MPQPRHFQTTRWSLVLAAGGSTGPQSREALAELCRLYWYPIYGFIRRTGKSPEDALDLTQGLFADLLARKDVSAADPERGKFRSWLLTCAKNHLANQHDRAQAAKRGGGEVVVPIDAEDAEKRYRAEPTDGLTPEKLYLRRWMMSALERALQSLRAETPEKNSRRFELLQPYLVDAGEQSHAALGIELGLDANAVKQAIFQLRDRFREHLRAQLGDTVGSGDDVDSEIRQLLGAL